MPIRIVNEIAAGFPIGVSFVDVTAPAQPLVYVNPAFCELTGYDQAEVVGRNCRFLQGERTHPGHRLMLSAAIRAGLSVRLSIDNYRKDGTPFVNDVSIEPIVDGLGAPMLYLGTHRLADESSMSEEQYFTLHDMLRHAIEVKRDAILSARQLHGSLTQAVLHAVPSRILAISGDGTVGFANRAALLLLERTLYQVVGRPITEILDRSDIGAWCGADIPPGEHRFELTWLSPSNVRRELGISMVRLPTSPSGSIGDVTHVFVFRDMGEWRQHELELRRLKGMNALGQMAAGFAHEVRNPLAAMRSLAEALRGELDVNDPRAEYPARMLQLVSRIDGLVKSALRFGRPKPPSFRNCSAQQVVHEALEAFLPRLGRGKRPALEMDVGLPELRIDDQQAVEVLVNLVENALDAVDDASRVRIRVYVDQDASILGQFVRIDVSDDGPGIPNDELSRVFDPFFTTKPKGTGLGLAIAQRLARENGGHLLASSVPGVETTFSLLLPLAPVSDAPPVM